jgi:hypothetical protein
MINQGVQYRKADWSKGYCGVMTYLRRSIYTCLPVRLSFSRIYCTTHRFNMSTKTLAVLDDVDLKDGEMYVHPVLTHYEVYKSLSPISPIVIIQEGSRFRRWKGSFISPGR